MSAMLKAQVTRQMGDRIRSYRQLAGLTWDDLGARIGRSRVSVKNMENGPTPATAVILCQIARELGAHPAEFLLLDAERQHLLSAAEAGTLPQVLGLPPSTPLDAAAPAAPPPAAATADAPALADDAINAAVGARLRQLRIAAGLTQAQIAAPLRLSLAAIDKIESGRLVAKMVQVYQFAAATGHPPGAALVFDAPGCDVAALLTALRRPPGVGWGARRNTP